MSFPPANEMFQFAGFASPAYVFSRQGPKRAGFPHSDIHGSKGARPSPRLFAACHVLHRLSVPRHPPNALKRLIQSQPSHTENKAPIHGSPASTLLSTSSCYPPGRSLTDPPQGRLPLALSRQQQPPQQGNRPKQPVAFLSTM
jgi:hypothetical protein